MKLDRGFAVPGTKQCDKNLYKPACFRGQGRSDCGLTQHWMFAEGMNDQNQTTDSCKGDSGGPLVVLSGNTTYLVGATSHGRGCGGEVRLLCFVSCITARASLRTKEKTLSCRVPCPIKVWTAKIGYWTSLLNVRNRNVIRKAFPIKKSRSVVSGVIIHN